MYTTVDMRALQDRLDAITTPVAEEVAVEAAAPEVEQVELADGDTEFNDFKDILGRSGVMGFSA
jgi:hypothetical protein